MVSQSDVKWEVAADLKGCQRFFPNKKARLGDMERERERGAPGGAHGAS